MENFSPTENQEQPIEQPRSQFLTALCILSYIWSGLMLLCLIVVLLLSGFIFEALEKIVSGDEGMPQFSSMQMESVDMLLNMGKGAFMGIIFAAIAMTTASLIGVIKMWKLQKWGFYIYAGVNGVGVLLNMFQGSFFIPIISIGFIVMYGINLKEMTK